MNTCDVRAPVVDIEVKRAVDALVSRAQNGIAGDDNLPLAWGLFAIEESESLIKVFEGRVTPANVEYLWSQFGQHGCVVDYALLLCAPGVMHPGLGSFIEESWLDEERREKYPTRYELCIVGAEIQTRLLMRDPGLLKKYHRMVLWSHLVYSEPQRHRSIVRFAMIGMIKRCFEDRENTDKYWWAARLFVMLAYATGREDLLVGVSPDELYSRFKTWEAWFDENQYWMVPDITSSQWRIDKSIEPIPEGGPEPMLLPELPCDAWPVDVRKPDPAEVRQFYLSLL